MKAKLKTSKMRRVIFVLVLFTLLFLIISVFSHQRGSIFEGVSNVRKNTFRAAKYDSLFWTPSDITVKLKKELMNQRNRNLLNVEEDSIHSQLSQATSSVGTKKSRAIESFERKHSGNNVVVSRFICFNKLRSFGQYNKVSITIRFERRVWWVVWQPP